VSLTFQPVIGIPLIHTGDDLAQIVFASTKANGIDLIEGDILVIAQKIVSKAEGRMVNLSDVEPSPEAFRYAAITEKDPRFIELVLRESTEVLRTRPGTIIVQHHCGFVCANAGIDHSNVLGEDGNPEDWVLLLPEDPDNSAIKIRDGIFSLSGIHVGIVIIDSHGRAWRNGTIGTAIGVADVPALVDLRGTEDLFGYHLRVTMVAAADELAAGASLVMGQAAEGTPVIHVHGFPYPLRPSSLHELIRPREMDLFR
jgi:coenzyme F420-0:L-glutamate ligase / coenzyme F420-1:gamma-L-glutamate ligase